MTVLLALGSGLAYGLSNFLGPHLASRAGIVAVLVVSQVAALIACVALVLVSGDAAPPRQEMLLGFLAGIGNVGGLICFYSAAAVAPLSIVAPIGAFGVMVPVAYGLATGDSLSATQAAGIVLAIFGGVLAARRTPGADEHHEHVTRGIAISVAGAAMFGMFLVALPHASEGGRNWALLDARLALVTLLLVWAGRRLRDVRFDARTPLFVVPGLLLVAGTLMFAAAAQRGLLSLVSVLNALAPVFTVALGVALLGERMSRAQATGVACALTGVVLIAV